jgi:hypothetical protein
MPTEIAPSEKRVESRTAARKLLWILPGIAVCAAIAVILVAIHWPFTRDGMTKRLEQASSARVEMRGFRSTYFPFPGCVAEDVVFHAVGPAAGPKADDPIISIRKLTIESTVLGLLSKPGRIRSIVAEGLRIHIPKGGANLHAAAGSGQDQTLIEALLAENAILEVGSGPGGKPLVFQIHRVLFRNIGNNEKTPFQIALRMPLPPGEVTSSGWLGPRQDPKGTIRSTAINGTYVLQRADLGVFKSIAGELSSRGEYSGTLEHLNVAGNTDSPQFEVTDSGHRLHLSTQFRGSVDLKNGDVVLPSLQARLGNTNITAHASVAGHPKTVTLNVTQGAGQIQDLFLLLSSAPTSPVTGPVNFHTDVVLPPEHRPFKQRVQLTGNFMVDPAKFTSPDSQAGIDQLSERANGKKDKGKDRDADDDAEGFDRVLTKLEGQVALRDGVATFSRISFSVPGAESNMHGTYNLVSKRVNLNGTMRMNATVSQATTGAKSFFLKIVDPFYKKKHAGAEVPIAMTGTYGHTHFAAKLK